jgi:hypothetical protein
VSGVVAAGMLMNGGTVRVLDETGKAIATGKAVTAKTGAYGPITLTGAGPFRVEACGTVGDHPLCVWGATTKGGTLNLTPLTSALIVLAGGQSPETLMSGPVQGLADTDLATAQTQVLGAIAPALADAGLAANFDLLAGTLTPGSHSGYDRLLDTVTVGLGLDTQPFVTLNSPLGSGLAYLEPGTTQGSFALDAAAASVDFTGIDGLYTALGAALPTTDLCPKNLPGLLDANVRASLDLLTNFSGAALSTQALCLHMSGSLVGDVESLIGTTLLPATPRRCDFGGGDPVCRIGLVFQTSKGLLRQLGVEQAVVKRPSPTGWKLLGNRLEVQATAAARLVLSRRADQTAPDVYSRFLDIAIPAYGSLQCARVSQKDASGADVALAFYKRTASGTSLSLWSTSASNAAPSLDPATGATRGDNLLALAVPNDTTGDATVRNFVHAGRALKVDLYGDAGCSTPLPGADGGSVGIDVTGQLPLNIIGMSGQPWPALAAASSAALVSLKGAVGTKLNYGPIWTPSRPGLWLNRAQLCTLDASCPVKLTELELAANATQAALSATLGTLALGASDYKLLRLTGRMPGGLVLQLDTQSCPAKGSGQAC